MHGCSAYKIDQVAQVLKQDYNAMVLYHRPFCHSTIFDQTLNDLENIFESYVDDADTSMAVSALTPSAPVQHEAVVWMNNYFHNYGDTVPNRTDEIHLSLPDKKSLWYLYKEHQEFNDSEYISLEKFYELWQTLYPRYTLREFIDIPGKCITCYEIDSIRKNNRSNENILKAAKKLFVMHRGGYFQRERDE
jgi:hypothetical protein